MQEHKLKITKQKHENHMHYNIIALQNALIALNLTLIFVEKSIHKSTSSYGE